MANAVRLRVELRPSPNKTKEEQFREMLHVFKRRCNECGILSKYKDYEFFESKSQKERKKRRESELRKMKEKQEQVSQRRAMKAKLNRKPSSVRDSFAEQEIYLGDNEITDGFFIKKR